MGQVYLSSFSPHFRRQLYQAGPSISNHLMMADDGGHFSQAAQRGGGNKAAGSAETEAYPCGTSKGNGRPRTQ